MKKKIDNNIDSEKITNTVISIDTLQLNLVFLFSKIDIDLAIVLKLIIVGIKNQ